MELLPGLIIVTILGLGWGSFATMAVYRLPKGLPWIGKKPFCPKCKHDLTFRDYVSVISFLSRQGKCRYCSVKYDRRSLYLYTEIATALVFIVSFLVLNMSESFLMTAALGTTLVILSAIEIEHQQLHPKVLLFLWMLAIVARATSDGTIYGILLHGGLSAIFALGLRHLIFAFQGRYQQSLDYLQYHETGRFSGEGMPYVILLTIAGVWLTLPVMMALLVVAIVPYIMCKLLFRKSLFSFWFGLLWISWLWYDLSHMA